MSKMAWHCYIEHYESVHRVNVIADSAVLAALEAAKSTGIAGLWTVVGGAAVEINIVEQSSFVAAPAEEAS